jgi:tetratricopeptide (TPR) repeat protein
LEQVVAGTGAEPVSRRNLAVAYLKLGDAYRQQNKPNDALAQFRKGVSLMQVISDEDKGNARWQHDIANFQQRISDQLLKTGDKSGARLAQQSSVATLERLTKADPSNADRRLDLGKARTQLAELARADGDREAALKHYRALLADITPLRDRDPANVLFQEPTAVALRRVGDILLEQGNPGAAVQSFRDGLAVFRKLLAINPRSVQWQSNTAETLIALSDGLAADTKLDDALTAAKDCIAIFERLGANPGQGDWNRELAQGYGKVVVLLGQLHRLSEGREAMRKSQAAARAALLKDPADRTLSKLIDQMATLEAGWYQIAIGEAMGAERFDEALRLQEAHLGEVEASETKSIGKPGPLTADAANDTSWQALLAHQPAKGLAAAERAHELVPAKVFYEINHAHALMFAGHTDAARALYLAHKDDPVPEVESKPWKVVITEDFSTLRKAGLTHPLMAEIDAAFSAGGK